MTPVKIQRILKNEEGVAMYLFAALLFILLVFSGLAIDLGRGYIVKAHLSKAVDGTALAAARYIGQGQSTAQTEASKIFYGNFPNSYLGTNNNPTPNFTFAYNATDGSNIITVNSTAVIPTTFMKVAGFTQLTVNSVGQATARLTDMAFVIDRSGSLGSQYPAVQQASVNFINSFDPNNDRIALIFFSRDTIIADPIGLNGNPSARGFNKTNLVNHVNGSNSNGNTSSAEAMLQAWDQLRMVPNNLQSGLRIIVFFTDGAPNTFNGRFDLYNGVYNPGSGTPWPPAAIQRDAANSPKHGGLHTDDFPNAGGGGTNTPHNGGLFQAYGAPTSYNQQAPYVLPTTSSSSPATGYYYSEANESGAPWNAKRNFKIPFLPNNAADVVSAADLSNPIFAGVPIGTPKSYHPPNFNQGGALYNRTGLVTGFPMYDPNLLGQRPLETSAPPVYPNNVKNTNNVARNLLEKIANEARNDTTGAYPIRIYTLGLGVLLYANQGTVPETGASILMRIANDPDPANAASHNSSQKDGKFFFAGDTNQLNAAFQAIRSLIIRLTQ
jgi:Flp pilus assembly protein TadG